MTPIWFNITMFIGIGLALYAGWFGVRSLITYSRNKKTVKESQSWHEGKARVIFSNIDIEITYDEDGEMASYVPKVQYVFQVGGQTYQGNQVSFGNPNYALQKKAQEVIAQYQLGSEVRVYYNPFNPEESVLEKVTFVPMVYLILGIIMVLIMVVILGLLGYWWIYRNQAIYSSIL